MTSISNHAQILTSIVEELDDECPHPDFPNPLLLLEEATTLFQQCLGIQEALLKDCIAQTIDDKETGDLMDVDLDDGGVSITNASSVHDNDSSVTRDECWATIIEPITGNTILETIVASFETLTTYCHLITPQNSQTLNEIQKFAQKLNTRFESTLADNNLLTEAYLTEAIYKCSFVTALLRCSLINIPMSLQAIDDAFADRCSDDNPRGLCEYADALLAHNNAIRIFSSEKEACQNLNLRWKALTQALDYLSRASKLSDIENVGKVHLARGDAELSRYQLGQLERPLKVSFDNAKTLLINAVKYYRGSKKQAEIQGLQTLATEASLKEALALGLSGDTETLEKLAEVQKQEKNMIIKQSLEDGLITPDQMRKISIDFRFLAAD